jgi:hypothetical protein
MRASVRQTTPGEADPELLMLGGCGGAAVCGLAWLGSGLPVPQCAFHAITGCPCPACGATRCVLSLLHGHIAAAAAWNPLAFSGLAALGVLNLYAAGAVAGWLPRLRLSISGMEARMAASAGALLVIANWAYLIHHGV